VPDALGGILYILCGIIIATACSIGSKMFLTRYSAAIGASWAPMENPFTVRMAMCSKYQASAKLIFPEFGIKKTAN